MLVEGKSDVAFLRHAANTLKAGGHLQSSLEDAGIVPILIGGCGSVKHWVTLNLADDLGLPWCVFLDSDIGGSPEQVASIAKRKQEVEARGRPFYPRHLPAKMKPSTAAHQKSESYSTEKKP